MYLCWLKIRVSTKYIPEKNGFNKNLKLTSPICENALLTVICLFNEVSKNFVKPIATCCQIFKIRLWWRHIDLMLFTICR